MYKLPNVWTLSIQKWENPYKVRPTLWGLFKRLQVAGVGVGESVPHKNVSVSIAVHELGHSFFVVFKISDCDEFKAELLYCKKYEILHFLELVWVFEPDNREFLQVLDQI